MANTIIYKSSNIHVMTPGQVITLGENGSFDTITERRYFGAGIPGQYEAGGIAKPDPQVPGTWINIGISDVERLPGEDQDRAVIATITWRGLKDAGNVSISDTCSIKETSYDSIGSVPAAPNNDPVKANVHDLIYGKSIRSIHTSPQNAPSLNPTTSEGKTNLSSVNGVPLGTPPAQIPILGMTPVYNHPWGWLPYSWQQEQPVPGIYFVTSELRYIYQRQFG